MRDNSEIWSAPSWGIGLTSERGDLYLIPQHVRNACTFFGQCLGSATYCPTAGYCGELSLLPDGDQESPSSRRQLRWAALYHAHIFGTLAVRLQ